MNAEPERVVMYAIRLKGTNKYLPMRDGLHGHSFSSPVSIDEQPPRVFFREVSAKLALGQWLRGKHFKHRSGGYSNYYGENEYEEYIDVVPQSSRKRENMEIVIFEATEIGHVGVGK